MTLYIYEQLSPDRPGIVDATNDGANNVHMYIEGFRSPLCNIHV